ncbi:MAG: hypothetical protein ACRDHY_16495 [Anaerolineales bacterium]
MARRITGVALLLAAACSGWGVRRAPFGRDGDPVLSYAQYRSLEKGMRAQDILHAFGRPSRILEGDGIVRFLSYRCENANGKVGRLQLAFDEKGTLETLALLDPDAPAPSPGKAT